MDVSAFLTSASINAVAEAFAVPESVSVAVSHTLQLSSERSAFEAALDSHALAQDGGPLSDISDTDVSDADGAQVARVPMLLSTLSSLSRAGVRDYLAQNPEAVSQLLASPPPAATVASWWATEDARGQRDLAVAAPQLIGNLEGLPYQVRGATNESYLDATIATLNSELGTVGRAAAADVRTRLHMLTQISDAVRAPTSAGDGRSRELISLDVTGSGRAVIVIGDLKTADYVTYLVPGMFYSVDTELVGWANAAAQLASDQTRLLDRLEPNQSSTVATVAWIGYQTPTLVDVVSLDLAEAGSRSLADSLAGLAAVRGADQPYLSMLTHSYGSTVALLALENSTLGDDAVSVDALAMVGSPGSDAQSVAELNVRDGNVWVADAALDPVAHAGVFGSQPLSPEYGAQLFGVDGGTDPLTGATLAASVGHVDYFTAGSESLRNMAMIGIGRGGYVLDQNGRTGAQARALGR